MSRPSSATHNPTTRTETIESSPNTQNASDTDQKVAGLAQQQIQDAASKVENTSDTEQASSEKVPERTLLQKLTSPNTEMPTTEQKEVVLNGALGGIGIGTTTALAGMYNNNSTTTGAGLLLLILSVAAGVFSKFRANINYENPQDLKLSRDAAIQDSLQKTVKQHGWENLFTHKILEPATFAEKFQSFEESASFNELIALYKDASKALESVKQADPECLYELPRPSNWRAKFLKEVEPLSFDKHLEEYSMNDLKAFDILPDESFELLYKAKFILEKKNQVVQECNLATERPLFQVEKKRGRTMEAKEKETNLAMKERLDALNKEEDSLKSAYLRSLASALPKSA